MVCARLDRKISILYTRTSQNDAIINIMNSKVLSIHKLFVNLAALQICLQLI